LLETTVEHPSGKRKTFSEAVLIPLAQTGTVSGLVMATAAVPVAVWGWWPGLIPLGGLASLWIAPYLMNSVNQEQWTKEKRVYAEPPKQKPLEPEQKKKVVGLEIDHRNQHGRSRQLFELPAGVSEGMFNEFVQGIISGGKSTAEGGWTGGGNLFSKAQYTAVREILIESGLGYWKGAKNQGWDLTAAGRGALGKHCLPPSPDVSMTPQETPPV
jgi:hypothetical protein